MTRNILLPDLWLTLPIFCLISLSVLILYSSDPRLALQQAIFAVIGLGLYFLVSLTSFEYSRRTFYILYLSIIGLLIFTFLLGYETRGSIRWIPLGIFQLQPSEFAKPVAALCLAFFWRDRIASWKNLVLSLLLIIPIFGLIFRQPDLGTALTILAIWGFSLIGANLSVSKMAVLVLLAAILVPVSTFFMHDYQKARIANFLSPNHDPLGTGYNVIQSTIAVGSGQLSGRGLGHGTQSRLQFLPEYRTDFIFASMAEEMGFIGSVLLLLFYGMIFIRGLRIISESQSRFYHVLVFSTLGMIFFQMFVNIGMNIGIMPVTGITLPLFSYGGSSMLSTLIMLGFISSASKIR